MPEDASGVEIGNVASATQRLAGSGWGKSVRDTAGSERKLTPLIQILWLCYSVLLSLSKARSMYCTLASVELGLLVRAGLKHGSRSSRAE